MTFRLSKDARQYFLKIEERSTTGKFDTLWDKYYLCLMAGFSRIKLGKETSASDEIMPTFIQDYSPQRYQIISLLIATEIKRLGIQNDDKENIKQLMLSLLDHTTITNLNDEGHKIMNRYTEGGFEIIREEIPQPYEFDVFMRKYYDSFIVHSEDIVD